MRRLSYAVALVFSEDLVIVQLIVMNIGSYTIILYTLLVKPYKQDYMNNLELANETIILFLTYMLWVFSDNQGSARVKNNLGWIYCFFIFICLLINIFVLVYFLVEPLILKLKKKKMIRARRQSVKLTINEP